MSKYERFSFYDPIANGPIAIAHRGGNAVNTEELDKQNTLAAFASAADLGVEFCETDLTATRDGELLVFHGSGTPRQKYFTTPEIPTRREIESMTFAETRAIKIGGEPIPTFAELLWTFPRMRFFVDPKTAAALGLLPEALAKTNSYERVCVGSFHEPLNQKFAEMMAAQEKKVAMTLSLGACAKITQLLVRGKISEAQDYFANGYAASWTALQHITKPMVDRLHADLEIPVFAHIWLPSEISRAKMDEHLDKNTDGLMGNQIQLIVDAISSRKKMI